MNVFWGMIEAVDWHILRKILSLYNLFIKKETPPNVESHKQRSVVCALLLRLFICEIVSASQTVRYNWDIDYIHVPTYLLHIMYTSTVVQQNNFISFQSHCNDRVLTNLTNEDVQISTAAWCIYREILQK